MSLNFTHLGLAYGLGGPGAGPEQGPQAVEGLQCFRELGPVRGLPVFSQKTVKTSDNSCPKHLREFLTFAEAAQPWLDTHCAGEQTPVFIGGDHSIGLVTFSFLHKKLFQEKGSAELGLLWVDAHADINTASTSPSGNLHGMVVANLLGMGVPELAQLYHPAIKLDPKNVAYVGLRDIDPGEEEYLSKLEIQRTSASEVRSLGLAEVLRKALAVVEKCRDGFVLSFDMDVCDPSIAPGVSTPVPGGLSREEMCTLLTQVGKSSKLRAAEFVELNPSKDHERKTAELLVQGLKALAGISR